MTELENVMETTEEAMENLGDVTVDTAETVEVVEEASRKFGLPEWLLTGTVVVTSLRLAYDGYKLGRKYIPKAWKAVTGLFGKKGTKVEDDDLDIDFDDEEFDPVVTEESDK